MFSVILSTCNHLRRLFTQQLHPEPYLIAVERSGFNAEECLVIEDTERRLIAARKAGNRCVGSPNEFMPGGKSAGRQGNKRY